jgi:Flp pilus assembly protein TadG
LSRHGPDDPGSVAVEVAILALPLLAVMALIVVIGRLGNAKLDVDAAAQTAARTISMAHSPADAIDAARREAHDALRVGTPTCRRWTFDARLTSTDVRVDVTCIVDLSAASMIPLPGTVTQTAEASEVRDRFEERG